jgi:nicotinamidase-related amidase
MTAVDDARMYAERGFGRTIGYGERPAVVAIDLIRAFTDPSSPLGADLAEQLARTRTVIEAARAAQLPVYYTSVAYEDVDLEDAGIWVRKIGALTTLRAGTPEVEVDPALGRRDGEPVITKKYASAFFGTDLLSRLTARRVDTLVITGCTTSGCVRATAVDAIQHGLRPIVALEAVGDRSASAHRQSLDDLQAKYADVVPVEDVLSYLAKLAR